jgi:arylsulfatase A-like enzyme
MSRPNILLINCHDLGRHLGCYGVPTAHSPNIDRLASEGARFARSFCVAPQCSPSRAAFFTGRYPHSNGMMGLSHGNFAWDLNATERHLAGLLRDGGYRTALVGVQHETCRPEAMGWQRIEQPRGPRLAPFVADCALGVLGDLAAGAAPFYLQVGFFEPHRVFLRGDTTPDREKGVVVPPFIKEEESARQDFAEYQGAIRTLDAGVGRILAGLDAAGLRENTLVLFTSDHGMPFPLAKCSLYDPGLHVPLIVRWPERGWAGGRVHDPMVPNIDVLPTLLDAAGLPAPAAVQGRSFLDLLDGGPYVPREEIFGEMTYHDYYDPMRCVRTERWKLIVFFTCCQGYMNPTQQARPLSRENDKFAAPWPDAKHDALELYDLAAESWEKTDLAKSESHVGVRAELLARLARWMRDTEDPILKGVPVSPLHRRAVAMLEGAM